MSSALTALSDEDALELLTALGDLEKSAGASRAAIAEVLTLIGNLGFEINRQGEHDSSGGSFTFDDMLASIKAQKFSAPRN